MSRKNNMSIRRRAREFQLQREWGACRPKRPRTAAPCSHAWTKGLAYDLCRCARPGAGEKEEQQKKLKKQEKKQEQQQQMAESPTAAAAASRGSAKTKSLKTKLKAVKMKRNRVIRGIKVK